jgi:hypothetical protein
MENKNIKAEIRAKGDDENRTVTFVASTYDKDRHGTILNQKNWNLDNFNANPIIGYQHNVYGDDMCNPPNPDDQLGIGRAYIDGDELLIDVTFEPADINPLAEKIFKKIQFGSLNAVSVGFVPLRNEKGNHGEQREDGFYFHGQELLEVSVVNIPSNPKALKKSFRDSTKNALSYLSKALNKRFSDIESMTIRDIMDALDKNNEVETKDLSNESQVIEVEKQEEINEVEKYNGKSVDLCKKILLLYKSK